MVGEAAMIPALLELTVYRRMWLRDVPAGLVQKSCSSGTSRYKSRVSGFEKALWCSTVFPAMICFTAISTFLPLRVYCQGRGGSR